jgi:hypothetical protein
MLRFEISERERGALPVIDVADDVVVIGSDAPAKIRLPAEAARGAHVRFDGQTWTLLAEAVLGGVVRAAGDSGPLGRGITLELGSYRVRVAAAPAGVAPTPPARTESLARELVRNLLGDGDAPTLEIERGVGAGTKRVLPPPESALVIGRGDEASWVILDEDLSRTHAEIRRGWDGVTVVDLGSKNGTRVNGAAVGKDPVRLRDGAGLTLGGLVLRFRDPAEHQLGGEPRSTTSGNAATARLSPNPWLFVAFTTLAVLALIALLWVVAS